MKRELSNRSKEILARMKRLEDSQGVTPEIMNMWFGPISPNSAQQNMHWTAGIVRRFKQFAVVKFILSRWSDFRQPPVM